MQVKKRDGSFENVDKKKITRAVERACRGVPDVDAGVIVDEAFGQIYDGITTADIDKATVLAARARIAGEPSYSLAAARLLLNSLYREAFGHRVDGRSLVKDYRDAFRYNLAALVDDNRLDPRMVELFDSERLAAAIQPERDLKFKYLGVQTLYDRYLQHVKSRRLETPQAFWMRVAMGVSLEEDDPTSAAVEFYDLFSSFRYCPSTPTLFNAGTTRAQLNSCFLSSIDDSIDGIYGTIHGQARLSKHAGGLGIDITPLRGDGSFIKGTNGRSNGYIPWARQINCLVGAVNQSGKRRGAGAVYSEVWHIDFPAFLNLKKNTGDERQRCHDLNTAAWICDLFMKQVECDGDWYLFSPDDVPDLHELHGDAFEKRYWHYAREAQAGRIANHAVMKARDLAKKMLLATKETGHPWWTFKDRANSRYANIHEGTVLSSNLCCVTGDQWVATDGGLYRVSELEKSGKPLRVAGRNGVVNATEMVLTIENSKVVRVTTREGYSHKVTPDHPLWVVGTGWIEAKDLVAGDRVELQQTRGLFGRYHDPEWGLMAGEYLAKTKQIPDFVWHADEATVGAFLDGVFQKNKCDFRCDDRQTMADLQLILLNYGRRSQICETMLVVSSIGKTSGFYAVVESVEEVHNEDVYCLKVDAEDRAWTCNGFITKNTEILEHAKATKYHEGGVVELGETAVCTIGSPNLAEHVDETGQIDKEKLAKTVRQAMRVLDNVVSLSYYPTAETRKSSAKFRFVGLGEMGWHDVLHARRMAFDSAGAVELAGEVREFIAYHAILASAMLAKERGRYPSYEGSNWSRGILPQDTWPLGGRPETLDWSVVRDAVKAHGMRNGLTQAVAPTATISSIVGCAPCDEPLRSVLYVYTTLSGDFTMINEHFVKEMKELGVWNEEFAENLKAVDGDVSKIVLPAPVKDRYKTAFDVDQFRLIDVAAARQKWIDQGQSVNLFFKGSSMKDLLALYTHAWKSGLPTTYYLHTVAASKVEKATVSTRKKPADVCRIGTLTTECESCQ